MFKNILRLICLAAFAAYVPLSAKIVETNEISDIQEHASVGALVLLNVTGTLYEPSNTLANNQWRIYFAERVHAIAKDKDAADRLVNKIKNEIVNHLPKKPVELKASQIIADLQSKKIPVLGITQKQMKAPYADNFALITSKHLQSIGIDLEKTLSYLDVEKNDPEQTSYSFAYGLIFTNKKPVGPALVNFLGHLKAKPTKIVMVDNSRESLEDAEKALGATPVQFYGFRYGRGDALLANFDPILGNIQFFVFLKDGQILSDADASQIKKDHPDVDYTKQLEAFIEKTLETEQKDA